MAVTGEMLEHRQQPGVAQASGVGAGVLGHLGRIRAERPVADHGVVGGVGDIDIGREIDGDAEATHPVAAVQRHAVDLVGGVHQGQRLRRRRRSDQLGQPRHPATLFIDADRHRQCRAGTQVLDHAVRQHRQVGPAADEDAADVVVGHHSLGVVAAAYPDHQQLSQLVAGGHRRQDRRRIPTRRFGRRNRLGRRRGSRCRVRPLRGVATTGDQRRDGGKHCQYARESHQAMLS